MQEDFLNLQVDGMVINYITFILRNGVATIVSGILSRFPKARTIYSIDFGTQFGEVTSFLTLVMDHRNSSCGRFIGKAF